MSKDTRDELLGKLEVANDRILSYYESNCENASLKVALARAKDSSNNYKLADTAARRESARLRAELDAEKRGRAESRECALQSMDEATHGWEIERDDYVSVNNHLRGEVDKLKSRISELEAVQS